MGIFFFAYPGVRQLVFSGAGQKVDWLRIFLRLGVLIIVLAFHTFLSCLSLDRGCVLDLA